MHHKVVIEGHADEISWYVNYITDDGLIYVIRNGGSETKLHLQNALTFIPKQES
jgi:putative aminopeptidase FrvX